MKARLAASAALALGLALGASGCSMITYQATTEKYEPSDGVSADLGDLDLRNILVVSEDGEDGTLVMSVVNQGDRRATLGVQFGEGDVVEVAVPAGQTLVLGSDDEEPVVLEGIDAEVGGLIPLYFQYGDVEGVEKMVPVLDGRLPEYSDLAP
ncbi:DNA modification methylase [Agromyces sp. H66]|uniref:DNA modification methylase n=1 Tax=Agromyces sp. H66 TaxID=2529859 RepID=UPI0010AA9F2B|nr:DNA modification methylase [Agromyces sp. H66]